MDNSPTPQKTLPSFLNLRDLARLFQISKRTAYRLAATGALPVYQPTTRGKLFRTEDVLTYLETVKK